MFNHWRGYRTVFQVLELFNVPFHVRSVLHPSSTQKKWCDSPFPSRYYKQSVQTYYPQTHSPQGEIVLSVSAIH